MHSSRGFGGLVTTEVDRVSLGTHHGHDLHARVERRSVRLTAGRRWHLSIGLGRTRPVAIEVSPASEQHEQHEQQAQYDLPIRTTDPWTQLARRIGAVILASVALLAIAGRVRRHRETAHGQ